MHRRNMLSISAITALGLALMPGNAVSQQKSLKDQLIGAWTLVSTKYKFPDGKTVDTFGPNPRGTMILDASGRMALINMPPAFPSSRPTIERREPLRKIRQSWKEVSSCSEHTPSTSQIIP
jgi:Lipocalin-like domain